MASDPVARLVEVIDDFATTHGDHAYAMRHWRQIVGCVQAIRERTFVEAVPDAALEDRCRHGWRGSPLRELIANRCPACGGQLFIGKGGWLTCSSLSCKSPCAAGDAIAAALEARGRELDAERETTAQLTADMLRAEAHIAELERERDDLRRAFNRTDNQRICAESKLAAIKKEVHRGE